MKMTLPGLTTEPSLNQSKAIHARAAWYIAYSIIAAVSAAPVTVWAGPNPPVEFSCQGKKDGNYKNPNDCASYLACSNGRKLVMPCPTGLHWDWHSKEAPADCSDEHGYEGQCLGQCTWPAEADCKVVDQ